MPRPITSPASITGTAFSARADFLTEHAASLRPKPKDDAARVAEWMPVNVTETFDLEFAKTQKARSTSPVRGTFQDYGKFSSTEDFLIKHAKSTSRNTSPVRNPFADRGKATGGEDFMTTHAKNAAKVSRSPTKGVYADYGKFSDTEDYMTRHARTANRAASPVRNAFTDRGKFSGGEDFMSRHAREAAEMMAPPRLTTFSLEQLEVAEEREANDKAEATRHAEILKSELDKQQARYDDAVASRPAAGVPSAA